MENITIFIVSNFISLIIGLIFGIFYGIWAISKVIKKDFNVKIKEEK